MRRGHTEGTPGATVVAIKRVDELGFYSLGRDQVAEKIGLSGPKTTAVIKELRLQDDPECFKRFVVGRTQHARYSPKAIEKALSALPALDLEAVWKKHGSGGRGRRRR